MSKGTSIHLQGVIHKSIIKPPKLDEQGFWESQDLEIVLHVRLTDGTRQKLPDISRLQNGQLTYIILHDIQHSLSLGEQESEKETGARPLAKGE